MKRELILTAIFATLFACISKAQSAVVGYTNNTNLTVGAGDSLSVGTGPASNMHVSVNHGTARTLNASAANSVTINVGQLRLGYGTSDNNTGTLNLSVSNTITASTDFSMGVNGTNEHGIVTTADGGTTVIYTPLLQLGSARLTNSSFTLGAGASLQLEGLSGGRTSVIIGNEWQTATGLNWGATGNMNLSGGTANLKLSSLIVGQSTVASTDQNDGDGTLTLSNNAANHLDISGAGTVVLIGNSTGGNQAIGTVTIGNLDATSSITSTDNSTAVLLGFKGGADPATGNLNLNGGTLTITTTGSAIAGGGGTSNLRLNGATLRAGTSSNDWINNLSLADVQAGGVTFDTDGFHIGTSQSFSGVGAMTKTGAGTLILSNASNYAGQTHIDAGAFLVNGSLSSGGGNVNVNANGTLGGTGTINRAVVLNGGVLSPGASAGTITIGGNLSGSGTYLWELGALEDDISGTAGAEWDLVSMTLGNANASGLSLELDFGLLGPGLDPDGGDPFWDTDHTWLVLQLAGATNNGPTNFGSIANGNFTAGTFTTFLDEGNQIYLAYTANNLAVPEPKTTILMVGALLGLAMYSCRRRKTFVCDS